MNKNLKRMKELEDVVETIPSPDGWLNEESKEIFVAQGMRLADRGFNNDEIFDILNSLYEATLDDFELGIEEVDDDGEGWKRGYNEET